MGKGKTLKYQVKERFWTMQKFGESRHDDKRKGISEKYIYSKQTMENYVKSCTHFAEWCKSKHGCKTLEDCKQYAQDYINGRIELSAYTLSSDVSALHKLYQGEIHLDKPKERLRGEIERSRVLSERNIREEQRSPEIVNFVKAVGCRREELIKVTPNDIKQVDDKVLVHLCGKGGKHRMAEVLRGHEDEVLQYVERGEDNKPIFEKPSNNLAIHHYRADYAKDLYRQIEESREMDNSENNLYHCRKDMNGTTYYKDVMEEVSQNLGHNRIDVIAGHYLYDM